ncbi:MAG TPA: hypothetical protein VGH74_21225 [Planctomycetaceae bacterium]|jgi:hypothetical protein
MVRSAEMAARKAKLAELKQLITSCHYDSLEKLEDAVDALLWGDVAEPDSDQQFDGPVGMPNRPR